MTADGVTVQVVMHTSDRVAIQAVATLASS